jgi:hypothetical protein
MEMGKSFCLMFSGIEHASRWLSDSKWAEQEEDKIIFFSLSLFSMVIDQIVRWRWQQEKKQSMWEFSWENEPKKKVSMVGQKTPKHISVGENKFRPENNQNRPPLFACTRPLFAIRSPQKSQI